MKVRALMNLIYKREIRPKGEEFEMDNEKAKRWIALGAVKSLSGGNIELDMTPSEGLPPLEAGKKKK